MYLLQVTHRQEMAGMQLTAKDTMLCGQRRYPGGGWPLSWTWKEWKSREKRMEPSRRQRRETWRHRQGGREYLS